MKTVEAQANMQGEKKEVQGLNSFLISAFYTHQIPHGLICPEAMPRVNLNFKLLRLKFHLVEE